MKSSKCSSTFLWGLIHTRHGTPRTTQRKQMGPIVVNRSVHTAHKQHQRKNVLICKRVPWRVQCERALRTFIVRPCMFYSVGFVPYFWCMTFSVWKTAKDFGFTFGREILTWENNIFGLTVFARKFRSALQEILVVSGVLVPIFWSHIFEPVCCVLSVKRDRCSSACYLRMFCNLFRNFFSSVVCKKKTRKKNLSREIFNYCESFEFRLCLRNFSVFFRVSELCAV